MGNLNQRQETNYSDYFGPNGIIPNRRPPAETTTEKPIIVTQTTKVEETPPVETPPVKNLSPRCAHCNKKLGIANQFQCRCQNLYCIKHMHSFNHQCTFNYKQFHKEQLIKENPKIDKEKLTII